MDDGGAIVEVVEAIDVDDDGVDVVVVGEGTEHVVVRPEFVATLVERPSFRISSAPIAMTTPKTSVPPTTAMRILTRALQLRGAKASRH